MAGFVHTTAHGQLSIAATSTINLMDARWRCLNLKAVESVAIRGSSLIRPTAPGRLSRARYLAELVVGLEMIVNGSASDSSGTATSGNVIAQLATNTRALRTLTTPPSSTPNVGWVATYTAGDGVAKTANVFVQNFQAQPDMSAGGRIDRVTFDLVIPAGTWT